MTTAAIVTATFGLGISSYQHAHIALAAAGAHARDCLLCTRTPSPAEPELTKPAETIPTYPDPH
jgi:hypothetical protein